jgi:hypothetical protein
MADVLEYVVRDDLFKPSGKQQSADDLKMDVDTFKRTFFPKYFQVDEEDDDR